MPSSIFGPQRPPQNAVLRIVEQVRNGGGARAFGEALAYSNPAFAQFVRSCEGKTPEQVAAENGVDIDAIRRML